MFERFKTQDSHLQWIESFGGHDNGRGYNIATISRTGNFDNFVDFNALTAAGPLLTRMDFTLSRARRFYSSMGNPFVVKRLSKPVRN